MAKCPYCDSVVPDGTKFCPNCGGKQQTAEAVDLTKSTDYPPPITGSYSFTAGPSGDSGSQSYSAPAAAPVPPVEEAVTEPAEPIVTEPVEPSITPPPVEEPKGQNYTPPPADTGGASYTPPPANPVGMGYTPPPANPGGPAYAPPSEPGKGSGKKKPFLIIGIIAASVAVIAILASVLGGKSNSKDPNLGLYTANKAASGGLEIDISTMFPNGFTIELKDRGKCAMNVDGEKGTGKWTVDADGAFSLSGSGLECSGTLKNGVLILKDALGEGLDITFLKDGASDTGSAAKEETKDAEAGGTRYYKLVSLGEGDDAMTAEDLAPLANYVILYENNTGWVCLFDEAYKITWTDTSFEADGHTYSYTISGDIFTMDYDGTPTTFKLSDETPPEPEEKTEGSAAGSTGTTDSYSNETYATYADFWAGDWYGWWIMTECHGKYESNENDWWDCCAKITVTTDNKGHIDIWDEDGSKSERLCSSDISLSSGTTSAGAMMSETGTFSDAAINHADWIVDPGADLMDYNHMITIDAKYTEPGNSDNYFEYTIYMRPWGMKWDDVEAKEPSLLPYYYSNWYLPLLQSGSSMPDKIGNN